MAHTPFCDSIQGLLGAFPLFHTLVRFSSFPMKLPWHDRDRALRSISISLICIFALINVLIFIYYERKFFAPFRKLQKFAHLIAAGNLDIPLEMGKQNLFGAFTESFDLMRTELQTARENEYRVNQSKKELVASLSHDIKTPLASIMSAMDIMLVKAADEKERQAIESVNIKLEQINTLVTNMFHSTLEELQALIVTPYEIQSTDIPAIIQNADYERKVSPFTIPHCIILADSLRLQQVFDNVIHNSYKYAGTDILISAGIEEKFLIIEIKDFCTNLSEDELPLIFNKFYRGKNAEKSDGYGLGLYISKYFMEKMFGEISSANRTDGFAITLTLKLAGA